MDELDTAADAPVTEEAVEVTPDAPDSDEAYSAIYDNLMERPEGEQTDENDDKAMEAEVVEAKAPVDPAPSDLPLAIKAKWAEIDADVRDAVSKSHREMSQKLAEQGRLVQGISPVRDALQQAARDIPHLMNMVPAQVATEILSLARISHDFNTQPVETIMGLIAKHNMADAVKQALGNAPAAAPNAALTEIRALQQRLARFENPDYIREQVAQATTQERVMGGVQDFASKADHWAEMEQYLPDVIPLVQKQLGEGASAQDVLSKSYDLALSIYAPDAKAKAQPSVEVMVAPDPKKTEAVLRAKSVNVTGRPHGQTRELSEDENYAMVYDRAYKK